MGFTYKLFNFQGSPVLFRITFLLLFLLMPPSMVVAAFISILLHELAHAYTANKLGYQVNNIYIDVFGGAAEMDLNHIPEKDSMKIIAAGPLSNLILFAIFSLVPATICYGFFKDLSFINLLLFAFNILPIKPMDGGLLLRDILLSKMRKQRRNAIKISNYISLFTAIGLAIVSAIMANIIMAIFACLFIYYSVVELGWLKKI